MKNVIRTAWALLLACIVGVGMVGCVEAEEGEGWDEWEFRNAINCGKLTEWHIIQIKNDKGEWVPDAENTILTFNVQFFSKDHNFHSTKFFWTQSENLGWIADQSTLEEYKPADNTAFTIDPKKLIIEGTVGGEKYFRINLNKKVEGSIEGKLYFYRDKTTYEVIMLR
ncbi:MAG: hypothetical protein J6Y04_09765 [Bacteroidaceae bacterium]|nr:hypothetical protein [Bacteroidaceae bacterium]